MIHSVKSVTLWLQLHGWRELGDAQRQRCSRAPAYLDWWVPRPQKRPRRLSKDEPRAEVVDERQDHDPDDGDADDQRQALHQVGDRGQPLAPDHHELIVRREVQVMAPVLRFGIPVNPFRPLFPVD
jgi:hypothetical protein